MEKTWLSSYPEGTPAEIDPDAYRSLVAIFDESCRRYGERPAYHNLGVTLTYAHLERLSIRAMSDSSVARSGGFLGYSMTVGSIPELRISARVLREVPHAGLW